MKKIALLLLAGIIALQSVQAGLLYVPTAASNLPVAEKSKTDPFAALDAKTFLSLTPSKVKALTGKKMSFAEKISLKVTQWDLKRQMKKGKEVDMAAYAKRAASGVDPLWLILGLILGLIGVIIALVTKKGPDDNRVKSSLIGWGIWVAIVLIAFAL